MWEMVDKMLTIRYLSTFMTASKLSMKCSTSLVDGLVYLGFCPWENLSTID